MNLGGSAFTNKKEHAIMNLGGSAFTLTSFP